jgi:hypothetical protein
MAAGAPDADVLTAWRRLRPGGPCAPALAVLLAHLHPGNMRVDVVSPLADAVLRAADGAGGSAEGGGLICS